MDQNTRCFLWIVGGPIAALILGWIIFFVLCFLVGGGIDIDGLNPPWQQAISGWSLPIGGTVFVAGTIYSLYKACMALKNK
jgi:hypothetical protein